MTDRMKKKDIEAGTAPEGKFGQSALIVGAEKKNFRIW
jgi:hypothetical protein